MKYIAAIVFIILLFVGEIILTNGEQVIRYDCRIAEISPDYPVKVKELCRVKH